MGAPQMLLQDPLLSESFCFIIRILALSWMLQETSMKTASSMGKISHGYPLLSNYKNHSHKRLSRWWVAYMQHLIVNFQLCRVINRQLSWNHTQLTRITRKVEKVQLLVVRIIGNKEKMTREVLAPSKSLSKRSKNLLYNCSLSIS